MSVDLVLLTFVYYSSALMEEKLKSPPVTTGLITMSGELKASEEEAILSHPLDDFKSGKIRMILGHPESWLTSVAEQITVALKGQGLVVGTFLDEFQMNLKDHWILFLKLHLF